MYRRRSPRRGDCPLALCCMAFGLGVLLALCGELRTALVFAAIGLVDPWLSLPPLAAVTCQKEE